MPAGGERFPAGPEEGEKRIRRCPGERRPPNLRFLDGVQGDEISRQRLIAWIDAMCPYLDEEAVREIPDLVFQGVDWLAIRPRIAAAPRIVRPGPVDPLEDLHR